MLLAQPLPFSVGSCSAGIFSEPRDVRPFRSDQPLTTSRGLPALLLAVGVALGGCASLSFAQLLERTGSLDGLVRALEERAGR